MWRTGRKIQGLAVAAILLAVVLLVAIAIAIALAGRFSNASSGEERDKLLATTILNEAQQVKTAFDIAISNGLDANTVTVTGTAPITKFWPASAGIPEMIFPSGATLPGVTGNWYWHGASSPIIFKDIGSSAGNLLIEVVKLTQSVCQQINLGLNGNTTIQTVATNGWDNGMSRPIRLLLIVQKAAFITPRIPNISIIRSLLRVDRISVNG